MRWRWVIRGVSVALLAVCVAAWVGSHYRSLYVSRLRGGEGWRMNLDSGTCEFKPLYDWGLGNGWHWTFEKPEPLWVNAAYHSSTYRFAGFAWKPLKETWPIKDLYVAVPLWFPSTVAAGLLGLVWWRTKRRKGAGGGFPVEVGGVGGKEARKA